MTKEEKKAYDKKYSEINREKRRLASKAWRENNKDKEKEYSKSDKRKEYRSKNAKSINRKTTLLRKANKEKWNEYRRSNYRKRTDSDPLFRLKTNIKSLISDSFKKKDIKKSKKTVEILGCTFIEYKSHIENQFESWMNWDNYGSYRIGESRTWQVDHIIPVSSAKNKDEIIKLNHYTNLRPLCSKENIEKGNKMIL